MAPKRRSYLAAIIGKAWEEVSFIEVLSEAIGGFVLALILLLQGWEDKRGAFELAAECIGCAILVPLIAFSLRVLVSAPAELVKEAAASKKGEEIEPKSIYPTIVAILLGICSLLIIILGISIKFNLERNGETPQSIQASIKELPKPLPDKIISKPKPPLAASAQFAVVSPAAITNAPTTTEFENDSPPDGIDDAVAILAKAQSESQKQRLEAEAEGQAVAQKEWEKLLPEYTYTLQSLYDVLRDMAAKRGDGISKTEGYFQCLPPVINLKLSETK